MTSLETSWQRAWRNLKLAPPAGLFARLLAAYGQTHRHYHSVQHLEECMAHFGAAIAHASQPGEIEIALWFHDAIYDPRGKSNERLSADWAVRELAAGGATDGQVRQVDALVMATCHLAAPVDADQRLLVDIDLAILGSSPARFAQYEEQVKAEYAWVPDPVYQSKRKEVLGGFLARESIYGTRYFKEKYERQARVNLQQSMLA